MFVIIKLKDVAKKAEVLVLAVLMAAVVIYALPSGNMTAAFGSYGSQTLVIDPGHGGLRLGHTHRGMERIELAVDITDGNGVAVVSFVSFDNASFKFFFHFIYPPLWKYSLPTKQRASSIRNA
mgnify:CR=1 FL=1